MKLFKSDLKMQKLYNLIIEEFGELEEIMSVPNEKYFADICESIIGQQLSTKVAPIIFARVRLTLGLKQNDLITAEPIIKIDKELLRKAGLSYSKINYIKNLAEAWKEHKINYMQFSIMKEEDIINELVTIKGIGKWTAEMFLIFSLGKKDVFSLGDYALKKAIIKHYNLDEKAKNINKVILELSLKWFPERTLASRVLWKSLQLS